MKKKVREREREISEEVEREFEREIGINRGRESFSSPEHSAPAAHFKPCSCESKYL